MTPKVDDVAVIVRSAGERTEGICHHLACQQVPEHNVVVVREKPFSAALVRSFEAGLDLLRPWTICIDADVLLAEHAIDDYCHAMAATPDDVLGLSGYLFDKFYGRKKRRGFHIYRTAHLNAARKVAINADHQLRPETWTKEQLAAQGHEWRLSPAVYGIHDDEQSYVDIFRKMATRAQKSPDDFDMLLARAMVESSTDADFLVAAWGLRFGASLRPEQVALHADQWTDVANTLMVCHGLPDKPRLTIDAETTHRINVAITRHVDERTPAIPALALRLARQTRRQLTHLQHILSTAIGSRNFDRDNATDGVPTIK